MLVQSFFDPRQGPNLRGGMPHTVWSGFPCQTGCEDRMRITVQHGCDLVRLDVNSSDTVASVKERLTREHGILFDNLVCAKFMKLEDNYTLHDYGITQNGWWLQCEFVLTILKLNGETFSVDCEARDGITTVKVMIGNMEGIPVSQQRLIFDGEPLDDYLALFDYGIQKGSVVTLLIAPDAD